MTTPITECIKEEQGSVIRFLCSQMMWKLVTVMEVWQFSMAITVRARGKHANGWKYSKEKRYRKL